MHYNMYEYTEIS